MFRYLVVVFALWISLGTAGAGSIPRPPSFSADADPEEILARYPLNVLNEQLAFSYYGAPVRKVTLPNGHTGWVYEVGGTPRHQL